MTTARLRNAGRTTNWVTAVVFTLVFTSFGLFAQARVNANELAPITQSALKPGTHSCILCTQSIDIICASATSESLIKAAGEILYN